ncbi:MAG: tetratricopeptide repeat protein [Steroidobacteraceae bacterium]
MRESFMKFKGIVAAAALGVALVVAVSALHVTPAYAAGPSKAITRPVALKLQAAQKAIQAGNFTVGLADLDQVSGMAAAHKSPYAMHILNQLYVFAYEKTHSYAKLAPKLEALLSDAYVTPAQTQQFTVALAQIYYQLHNFPKAIQYGTEAIQKHFAGAAMQTLVGQSYYLQGDWKQTIGYERGLVNAAIQAGQKPSKQSLELIQSSCMKLHDQGCLLNSLEQLVVYYPQRQYWQYLLFQTFKSIKSDANLLEAYRLAFDVGVMQQAHEFNTYAELAIEAGSPGEAEQVLNSALKNNVFTDAHQKAKAERILQDAEKRAASDQKTLAHTAQLAGQQAKGNSDVRVGLAYFGYQHYHKAVQLITQGIAKGGLARPAEAHLLLGIAQLKAGNKAAALNAFNSVKGDPTLQRLAELWSLKAKSAG